MISGCGKGHDRFFMRIKNKIINNCIDKNTPLKSELYFKVHS